MVWIRTVPYREAAGLLLKLYDRIKGPDNNVDNIMLAHSLRPHTLEGHMTLYKNVLHHPRNAVPKWFLETVGIYTSMLNECDYCVEHHYAGLTRLLGNEERPKSIRTALESDHWGQIFERKETAALDYVRKLTESPASVQHIDVQTLRQAGWEDGEILEINQATAYFGYANRTVLGLGVNTDGDILGLSPSGSESSADWRHR